MKKMLKSKLTLLLLLLACASLCFGIIMASPQKVKADSEFKMGTGASIRLDEPTGVKFTAIVPDGSKTYGMLIVPYDYFEKTDTTISDTTDYVKVFTDAKTNGTVEFDPIICENIVPIQNSKTDEWEISHSIADILEGNYRRQWFGVAFYENEGAKVYATTSTDNLRSIVQVAGAALNDYYYNPDIDSDTKELYETGENLEVMESFVTKGIAQKITDFSLEISGATEGTINESVTLTTNLPSDLNLQVKWSISDDEIATIDDEGKVTFLKGGTVEVTAKLAGIYTATHTISDADTAYIAKLDNISKRLVNETNNPSHYFEQALNTEDKDNIYAGENSIKLTYNSAKSIANTYNIDNGGTAFTCENNRTTIYDAFTAYNSDTQSYAPPTDSNQSTYAGFWVKNTTGKELKVSLAIKIYDANKDSVWLCGSAFTSMDNALTIAADDTEWKYYKVQLNNFISIGVDITTHRIRMGLAASINGVSDNDSFYIDNFDIFYGEKISENAEIADNLAKTLVRSSGDRTLSIGYTQELNLNAANVKEGLNSIKATYTGENTLTSNYDTYLTENGGSILGIYASGDSLNGLLANNNENVNARKYVSAYTSDTFKSATEGEKTYVGFWVKNTTGKTLKVGFTLRAWDSSSKEYLSGTNNRFHNYTLELLANDTEWHYFEMDLTDYCPDAFGGSIIRMGLGAQIEGATVGDTFYVDSFDIYHGSRVN